LRCWLARLAKTLVKVGTGEISFFGIKGACSRLRTGGRRSMLEVYAISKS
jgi:hypothetical protein